MIEKSFFEKFELIADSPNAVAKMRDLVFDLAFAGRLTGAGRENDDLSNGWETQTIESICTSLAPGFACSKSHQLENGHVHLRTHNVSTLGNLNFDSIIRIDPRMVDPQKSSIRAGDILFNNTNSQELVGKTCLVDRDYDFAFSNHITRLRLREGVDPGFVVFYLTMLRNNGFFAKLCTRWINQAAVNTDTLKKQTIPVPPHDEQKRIVAKVGELMALCDQLEAQQQERETRKSCLVRASLARFTDAPTTVNLGFLFHKSYDIPPAELRKSILTLAMQGKLVPQDFNDEPAEKLLSRIQTRLAEMQSASRIPKREIQFSERDGGEEMLPYSWKKVRIGELCLSIVPQRDKPLSFTGDIPWVTLPVFRENSVSLTLGPNCDGLSLNEVAKYRLRIVPSGSVLMSCVGKFGLVALLDRDVVPNQQIHGFYFPTELLEGRYLCYSIMAQKTFLEALSTTTTIAYLNKKKCESVPIALPPLAEQKRIVAKVDQLMALVDDLEREQESSRTTASKLLDAIVNELTDRN